MDEQLLRTQVTMNLLMVQAMTVNANIAAMEAENARHCHDYGNPAYGEDHFEQCRQQLEAIATQLGNLF